MLTKYVLKPFSIQLEQEDRVCAGDKNLGLAIKDNYLLIRSQDAIRYYADVSKQEIQVKLLEEPVPCVFIANYFGLLYIGGYEDDIPESFFKLVEKSEIKVLLPPSDINEECMSYDNLGKMYYTRLGTLRVFSFERCTDEFLVDIPSQGPFALAATVNKIYVYDPKKIYRFHLKKEKWKSVKTFHPFDDNCIPIVGTDTNYTKILLGGAGELKNTLTLHTVGEQYWRSGAPIRGLEIIGAGAMKFITMNNRRFLYLLTEHRGLQVFSVNYL